MIIILIYFIFPFLFLHLLKCLACVSGNGESSLDGGEQVFDS